MLYGCFVDCGATLVVLVFVIFIDLKVARFFDGLLVVCILVVNFETVADFLVVDADEIFLVVDADKIFLVVDADEIFLVDDVNEIFLSLVVIFVDVFFVVPKNFLVVFRLLWDEAFNWIKINNLIKIWQQIKFNCT